MGDQSGGGAVYAESKRDDEGDIVRWMERHGNVRGGEW
jgi:hypothetical protein